MPHAHTFSTGGVLGDELVHEWLRHIRRVDLIVAIAAISDKINHEIFTESLPELRRKCEHAHHALDVVRVNVEDRRIHILRHVRRVRGGTGVERIGREPDLVIDDDVDGTMGGVVGQVVEMEGLVHDPLSGKGRVAVHQHRAYLLT